MSLLRQIYVRHGRPIKMCAPTFGSRYSVMDFEMQYDEIATVDVQIPQDDWLRIEAIVRLFERQQQDPGLRNLADQYFMYEALIGEKR